MGECADRGGRWEADLGVDNHPQVRPTRQICPCQGVQETGSMVDYPAVLVNRDAEPSPMSLWTRGLSSSQTSLSPTCSVQVCRPAPTTAHTLVCRDSISCFCLPITLFPQPRAGRASSQGTSLWWRKGKESLEIQGEAGKLA